MKKLLTALLITGALFFSGCAEKRIVLVPQSQDCTTFVTQDFEEKQDFDLELWEEKDDNGTYLIADKEHLLKFIEWSKQTKSDYNTLLKQLKQFNLKIEELNKIQNSKEPQEVDDYNFK